MIHLVLFSLKLLPMFARQWTDMMNAIDTAGHGAFHELSEKAVSEVDYYFLLGVYGHISFKELSTSID